MDMVLRSMQGMDFDPEGNGGSPKQLLTKDADFKVTNSYDVPADYADQFKKLWLERLTDAPTPGGETRPALDARGLTKTFTGVVALDHVDLTDRPR